MKVKLKRLLKWTIIVVVSIVSVVVLIVAVLNWRAARSLEAKLRPLREAGKPLSIQELQRPQVPDEQNAAKAIEPFQDVIDRHERLLAQANAESKLDDPYLQASAAVARTMEDEYPGLNQSLRNIGKLADYQIGCDYTQPPTEFMQDYMRHSGTIRGITRVLSSHGYLSLDDGEVDEAARDAIAIVNWSRHAAREPLLVGYMVEIAVRGVGWELGSRCFYAGGMSPEVRTELVKTLVDEEPLIDDFIHALDSERAFGFSSYNALPGPVSWLLNLSGDQENYLYIMAGYQQLAQQPSGLAPPAPGPSYGHISTLMVPALDAAFVTLRRTQAQSRVIQILARWQDLSASPDASLDDLKLPRSVTIDPFNGLAMKLVPAGDCVSVYSVGKNLVDDHGSVTDQQDIGVAPPVE